MFAIACPVKDLVGTAVPKLASVRSRFSGVGSCALTLGMFALAVPLNGQIYSAVGDSGEGVVRVIQTNSAGTNAHVIDPETNRVVAVIEDVGKPHGAALHPEGLYYYITNEAANALDVIDTRTLERVDRIPLRGTPHNPTASALSRNVYVPMIAAPFVQVVDMDTHEVIKDISTAGGVHNTFVTPDQRYVAAGMIGARTLSIIDVTTDEIVWSKTFEQERPDSGLHDGGVRPMAFETNEDGSTKRLFVQISGHNGFYVIDWETREVVDRISPPVLPVTERTADAIQGSASHGAIVLPDQSALWISSRLDSRIYGWTLPELEFIGGVEVGNPAWLTATPDSRHVYIGVANFNETVAVDVQSLEVVARIPVGQSPKRIVTMVLPPDRVELAGAADR